MSHLRSNSLKSIDSLDLLSEIPEFVKGVARNVSLVAKNGRQMAIKKDQYGGMAM